MKELARYTVYVLSILLIIFIVFGIASAQWHWFFWCLICLALMGCGALFVLALAGVTIYWESELEGDDQLAWLPEDDDTTVVDGTGPRHGR